MIWLKTCTNILSYIQWSIWREVQTMRKMSKLPIANLLKYTCRLEHLNLIKFTTEIYSAVSYQLLFLFNQLQYRNYIISFSDLLRVQDLLEGDPISNHKSASAHKNKSGRLFSAFYNKVHKVGGNQIGSYPSFLPWLPKHVLIACASSCTPGHMSHFQFLQQSPNHQ